MNQQLGKGIQQAEALRNIKSKDLADSLGYSSSHISMIENGNTWPTREFILSVEQVLDLFPGELLTIWEAGPDEDEPNFTSYSILMTLLACMDGPEGIHLCESVRNCLVQGLLQQPADKDLLAVLRYLAGSERAVHRQLALAALEDLFHQNATATIALFSDLLKARLVTPLTPILLWVACENQADVVLEQALCHKNGEVRAIALRAIVLQPRRMADKDLDRCLHLLRACLASADLAKTAALTNLNHWGTLLTLTLDIFNAAHAQPEKTAILRKLHAIWRRAIKTIFSNQQLNAFGLAKLWNQPLIIWQTLETWLEAELAEVDSSRHLLISYHAYIERFKLNKKERKLCTKLLEHLRDGQNVQLKALSVTYKAILQQGHRSLLLTHIALGVLVAAYTQDPVGVHPKLSKLFETFPEVWEEQSALQKRTLSRAFTYFVMAVENTEFNDIPTAEHFNIIKFWGEAISNSENLYQGMIEGPSGKGTRGKAYWSELAYYCSFLRRFAPTVQNELLPTILDSILEIFAQDGYKKIRFLLHSFARLNYSSFANDAITARQGIAAIRERLERSSHYLLLQRDLEEAEALVNSLATINSGCPVDLTFLTSPVVGIPTLLGESLISSLRHVFSSPDEYTRVILSDILTAVQSKFSLDDALRQLLYMLIKLII